MAAIKQGAFKTTPEQKQIVYFSDFDLTFRRRAGSKDIVLEQNVEAVKSSIRNIVFTNRGERMFNPTFGCDVRKMLFENDSPIVADVIKDFIKRAIEDFEPRARVIDVIADTDDSGHRYNITIVFSIINMTEPTSISFALGR